MDEAKVELKRLIAAYPGLTIRAYREAMPFSEKTLDGMCERLRRAGLPE